MLFLQIKVQWIGIRSCSNEKASLFPFFSFCFIKIIGAFVKYVLLRFSLCQLKKDNKVGMSNVKCLQSCSLSECSVNGRNLLPRTLLSFHDCWSVPLYFIYDVHQKMVEVYWFFIASKNHLFHACFVFILLVALRKIGSLKIDWNCLPSALIWCFRLGPRLLRQLPVVPTIPNRLSSR